MELTEYLVGILVSLAGIWALVKNTSRRAVLRNRLSQDIALWDKLPDPPAHNQANTPVAGASNPHKDLMLAIINRQIDSLAQLEDPGRAVRWREITWGIVFIVVGGYGASLSQQIDNDALKNIYLGVSLFDLAAGLLKIGIEIRRWRRARGPDPTP